MKPDDLSLLSSRVDEIRQGVIRAGGKNVKLIAVTKSFDVSAMIGAFDAKCDGVGENYAQEVATKVAQLPVEKRLPVHFIGRLQTNKVKSLINLVDVWQSVDRAELINEIAKRGASQASNRRPAIMLQVNATNELDKGGCQTSEVENLLQLALGKDLDVVGLMTVGPTENNPDLTRQVFRTVRKLTDDLGLEQCSMGMTGDYLVAVGEGANVIRVGSALFGSRT